VTPASGPRRPTVVPPVLDAWGAYRMMKTHGRVRDHRVTTRSRHRSWRLGALTPPAFSSGSGRLSPVYNVSQSEPVVYRLETSWNRGLSPPTPPGRFLLPRRTGHRLRLPCKRICAPC